MARGDAQSAFGPVVELVKHDVVGVVEILDGGAEVFDGLVFVEMLLVAHRLVLFQFVIILGGGESIPFIVPFFPFVQVILIQPSIAWVVFIFRIIG